MSWELILGSALTSAVAGFILKKVITPQSEVKWGDAVDAFGFFVGSWFTRVMNKITFGLWNKTFEGLFKVFLGIGLRRLADGTLRGLDSDNLKKVQSQ